MSKTEKRKQQMQLAEEGIADEIVFQRKLFTCVVIQSHVGQYRIEGIGFAKVRWPDKWEPDYGVALARKKALADIARQVMERGRFTAPVN